MPILDVSPSSKGNRFRRRRVELLTGLVDRALAARGRCRIVDLGGTEMFWSLWGEAFDWSRVSVTCVNLGPPPATSMPGVTMVEGDARDLGRFEDDAFDIAFSNSVIEHVGLWDDMEAMAREMRRLAPAYMIQTPYFWFPVEPHARTLLLHWLPESLAYEIVLRRDCGFWRRRETVAEAVRAVQSAKMLDKRQMRALFPDARLISERFLGLTKSLIAIREARRAESGAGADAKHAAGSAGT